ncbi:ABC transporter substrate-binding protein [Schleiferiaceae bacterium]|nr:ABC transporter substrate-binding protein [Schleiferiaceae bacterium]
MARQIPRCVIFSSLLFLAVFSGCQSDATEGRGQVFRYNEPSSISSLDPAFARDQAHSWLSKQLFSTLVKSDSLLRPVADLATQWTLSADGLTWTFTLRSDAYFHENPCFPAGQGRIVQSEDVVFSLERLTDPSTASPGAWVLENVAAIRATGATEVQIELFQPDAAFLGRLAMPYCGILPAEALAYYGNDFSSHPVGSGPFYLKAWARQEKLVMRKHPRYFGRDQQGNKLPYLEAVSVRFIPDRQAAFLEFVKGNLDFVSGVDASYKDQLFTQDGQLQTRWERDFHLQKIPFLNTEFLGIREQNPQPEYLGDIRVRRALNWAIDRKSMMRYLKNTIGIPGYGGILPAGMPGFQSIEMWRDRGADPWEYDPQRARKELQSAGILDEDGQAMPGIEPIVISTTASYRDICEYIQSAWGRLGLPVQVNVMPSAAFREDKSQGRLAVYRASWIADYPAPSNYFMLFESRYAAPKGPNASQVLSPEYDALVDALAQREREGSGEEAAFEIDRWLHEEALFVPLFYDESVRVFRKEWTGIEAHPMNMLDLSQVRHQSAAALR